MSPREHATQLLNDYARRKAALDAVTSSVRAEIINLTAALNQAAAPHEAELKQLEKQALALALEHGAEIFDEDKRSLTQNGLVLAVRESAAVEVDDEAQAIHTLRRDAFHAERSSERDTQMACNACLRVTVELDREYILRHFDDSPAWFAQYGIAVVDKKSASLKPAPKPRVAKSKTVKNLKTAEEPMESEAA